MGAPITLFIDTEEEKFKIKNEEGTIFVELNRSELRELITISIELEDNLRLLERRRKDKTRKLLKEAKVIMGVTC